VRSVYTTPWVEGCGRFSVGERGEVGCGGMCSWGGGGGMRTWRREVVLSKGSWRVLRAEVRGAAAGKGRSNGKEIVVAGAFGPRGHKRADHNRKARGRRIKVHTRSPQPRSLSFPLCCTPWRLGAWRVSFRGVLSKDLFAAPKNRRKATRGVSVEALRSLNWRESVRWERRGQAIQTA
jgi:hypothetical protein